MIAPVQKAARQLSSATQDRFVAMLPSIRAQARVAFCRHNPEAQEELVAEVVANAFCAFHRLVQRGRAEVAHPTPLAVFAIKQVCCGRRIGGKLNVRDVCSRHAQLTKGILVERLDEFDLQDGGWRVALVEDRHAGPAETAAARIDVAAWLRSLGRQKRRIAKLLAKGETTKTVARIFNLSSARISQLRRELRHSWLTFQGEPARLEN